MVKSANYQGYTMEHIGGVNIGWGGDQYSGRGSGDQQWEGIKIAGDERPAGTGRHPGGQMTPEWRGEVWGGTGAGVRAGYWVREGVVRLEHLVVSTSNLWGRRRVGWV